MNQGQRRELARFVMEAKEESTTDIKRGAMAGQQEKGVLSASEELFKQRGMFICATGSSEAKKRDGQK